MNQTPHSQARRITKMLRYSALIALALSPLLSSIAIAEGNTSASTATMGTEGSVNTRPQFNAAETNTGMGSNANRSVGGVYFDSNVNSTTCLRLTRNRDRYDADEYATLQRRCTEEGYFRTEVHSRTSLQ